jgi:PleD family two-component response regulator
MPPLGRIQLNPPEEGPDVPIRILVVDDSETIRQAVRALLKGMLNWIFAVRQKMAGLRWTWCGS